MSWAAVIAAGAAIAGSVYQGQQGKKAASAGAKGAQAGIDEQRRQFDLIMGMLGPSRALGDQSTNALARLYGFTPTMPGSGVPGYGAPGAATTAGAAPSGGMRDLVSGTDPLGLYSGGSVTARRVADPLGIFGGGGSKKKKQKQQAAQAEAERQNWIKLEQDRQQAFQAQQAALPQGLDVFQASPDYNFRRNEGMRGIENSFAARGGAASGNALRALNEFNSNLASSEFGNFTNRLLAMAGQGQVATNQGVSAAQYTGGNIANLFGQQANARASGIVDQTNAVTGGLNSLAGIYGSWMQNRKSPTTARGS